MNTSNLRSRYSDKVHPNSLELCSETWSYRLRLNIYFKHALNATCNILELLEPKLLKTTSQYVNCGSIKDLTSLYLVLIGVRCFTIDNDLRL